MNEHKKVVRSEPKDRASSLAEAIYTVLITSSAANGTSPEELARRAREAAAKFYQEDQVTK